MCSSPSCRTQPGRTSADPRPRLPIRRRSSLDLAFPSRINCHYILHPSALGKSLGPREMYFPIHPSSRQCTNTSQLLFIFAVSLAFTFFLHPCPTLQVCHPRDAWPQELRQGRHSLPQDSSRSKERSLCLNFSSCNKCDNNQDKRGL